MKGLTTSVPFSPKIAYTPVTTPSANITVTYDTVQSGCGALQVFSVGHPTLIQDRSGVTRLCYDRFGRMVHKGQVINGNSQLSTNYAYDLANHLTQVTTPKSTQIKYTRDALSRITAVKYRLSGQTTDTTLVKAVTYYPFGPVASITYNNGRVLTRSYDQDYVISGVTDTATGGLSLTFGRDVLGWAHAIPERRHSDSRHRNAALHRGADARYCVATTRRLKGENVSGYIYTIEPIHADAPADPAIDALLAELGFVFGPPAAVVVGWRLRLCVDDAVIEQRDSMGHAEGWADAERAGSAWLAAQGACLGERWFAHAQVGFQRMAWDHDFAQALTQRGF